MTEVIDDSSLEFTLRHEHEDSPAERVRRLKAKREQRRQSLSETRAAADSLSELGFFDVRQEQEDSFIDNTGEVIFTALERAAESILELPGDLNELISSEDNTVIGFGKRGDPRITGVDVPFSDLRVGSGRRGDFFEEGESQNTFFPDDVNLPDADRPDSAAGDLTSAFSQFLIPFTAALKTAQGAVTTTRAALTGAAIDFSVFDPQEQRFSDLLTTWGAGNPAFDNALTQYLRADVNDIDAEGRLKNAIEGLALGALTDAAFKSIKLLKSYRQAKEVAEIQSARPEKIGLPKAEEPEPVTQAETAADPVQSDQLPAQGQGLVAGSVSTDALQATLKISGEQAQEFASKVAAGNTSEAADLIDFNASTVDWDSFGENAGEIRQLINTTSEVFEGLIDSAKGGIQTIVQSKRLADMVGAKPAEVTSLFNDVRGDKGLTARVMAAERTLLASAQRLQQLARQVRDVGDNESKVALLRQTELHAAIQAQVKGAKTEIARSLHAMRHLKKASQVDFEEFENVARTLGEDPAAKALVDKLLNATDLNEINQLTRKSRYQQIRSAALEVWINGLLSGPKTHAINFISNSVKVIEGVAERFLASGVGAVRQGVFRQQAETVKAREALYQAYGTLRGLSDALRIPSGFSRSIGQSVLDWNTDAVRQFLDENKEQFGTSYRAAVEGAPIVDSRGRIEVDTRKAIRYDTEGLQGLARAVAQGGDLLGSLIRTPGAALTVSDDFFKTIAYRQQLNALAYRRAAEKADLLSKTGAERQAFISKEIADTLTQLPDDLKLNAIDFAQYQTFTRELGERGKAVEGFLARIPELRLILPFLRTPTNIIKQVAERSPLPLFKLLQRDFRNKLAQGGPEADLIIARITLGTAAMYGAWELAATGLITGGGPKGRNTESLDGIAPYSLKVGDTWVQYNRLEPLGMLLGTVADTQAIVDQNFDPDGDNTELEEAMQVVVFGVAKNITSKTYLQGVSQFFTAMSDPERYGENYLKNFASSFVPFSSALRSAARAEDPYAREAFTYLEAIQRGIPGQSGKLPLRRDILGRQVQSITSWNNPIAITEESGDPLNQELARLAFDFRMPSKTVDGVPLNAEQYSRYLELRGQHSFDFNGNLEDFLRRFIRSPDYLALPEDPDPTIQGTKSDAIKRVISRYQKAAKAQLMVEFPELDERVTSERLRRRPDNASLSQSDLNSLRDALGL